MAENKEPNTDNNIPKKPSLISRAGRWMSARKGYIAVFFSGMGIGVGLGFTHLDPIKALYLSAVINGVISVPIMALMMLIARRSEIMGSLIIKRKLQVLGWFSVICMALAVLAMFLVK
jgi:Mn2+/Fe2+ NRAMP family transporter